MVELDPTATLHAFDAFLAGEGLSFEGVVIGGAALHVLGYITRSTDDVDVLIPQVPEAIAEAAGRFAALEHTAALHLQTLGRQDLLCTKLVALVDREEDLGDCIAMAPSVEELDAAWPFVEQYEGNAEVREVYWIPKARAHYAQLMKALGHDGA